MGACRLRLVLIQLVLAAVGTFRLVSSDEEGPEAVAHLDWIGLTNEDVSVIPTSRVKFGRSAEVSEKCPALTLRETQPTSTHRQRRPLMDRLSFRNGDWRQEESRYSPVIPFVRWKPSLLPADKQLVSFWVTDIACRQPSVCDVSGVIELVIIDGKSGPRPMMTSGAQLEVDSEFSVLSIEVEGVYQPAAADDFVCMLGCAFLSDKENLEGSERNCNIMVQLHYPLTFNLTSRILDGTIQSMDPPEGPLYFSPIIISSQISVSYTYEATAEELVGAACSVFPELEASSDTFKASMQDFCLLANVHLSDGWLDIEPNWKCNGTTNYCRKVGPFGTFAMNSSFSADYNTSRAQILVQSFRAPCFAEEYRAGIPVSFVFRLVPTSEAMDLAHDRSGLDGQTIVAEGYLTNGSDTLCMVACKLNDSSGLADICQARICLHIPLSLSITHRNVFEGSISSLVAQDHPDSFFPLSFHLNLGYSRNFPWKMSSVLHYNYTKLDEAGAVLTQHEPESNKMKTSWLKYPSLIGEEVGHYQSLAGDLSLHYNLKAGKGHTFSYLDFEMIAIDEYLPFLWPRFEQAIPVDSVNDTIVTETNPVWTHRQKEARNYLNCSGTMKFSGFRLREFISLRISTEGYYSPKDGKMYMVGCRSIKASWQDMKENSYDLNEGMDCEIEIVLEYPTTIAAWLLSPSVKVMVHSNRPIDDQFHFVDISAETYPVLYKKQREDLLARKSTEGALSILTLSLMLICIVSQLLYAGNHLESVRYISLVMISIQAVGFAIPLVIAVESLLTRTMDFRGDYLFQEVGWGYLIIYLDKILALLALLFLVRLFEKVWRERAVVCDLEDSDSVPDERNVIVICSIFHTAGFILLLALRRGNTFAGQVPMVDTATVSTSSDRLILSNVTKGISFVFDMSNASSTWWKLLQEYSGLVEDLFLLPQAVALSLWDVNGKPLCLVFIVGLTLLQIISHAYNHIHYPGFDSYIHNVYANPSLDFYSHVSNLGIPVLAFLLAVLVYIQQRWNGSMRFPARFRYKPLGPKSTEMELISVNVQNYLPRIPEDVE